MGMYILLADARHIYRRGLRDIFSSEPFHACITEAISSDELKSHLATTSFDVVIAHQSLVPDISILPRDRFVLFVSEPKKETLLAALHHGVRGYFSENPPAELLKVTVSLPPGQCLFDPALTPGTMQLINDWSEPILPDTEESQLPDTGVKAASNSAGGT